FYTNGIDYYIWDDRDYPERKISGIYSKRDLESLNFMKNNRKTMKNPPIRDEITNRDYQKEAITRTLESYETGHRKALLLMATGTGKTYVFIKTMFELNKRYGWTKFIIVVPSIAIREGIKKSFDMTEDHFMEQYGKKIRNFIYD